MDNNIHKDHRERVRKRYLNTGLDSFEDHQVLELLLFYCIPQKDTNPLAHRLLNEFGNLHTLFEADALEISRRCKVSENVAVMISLIPSLSRRYFNSKWDKKPLLDSSKKAGEYAVTLFTGRTVEFLYMFCLNRQRMLIYPAKLSEGTLSEAVIYPRNFVEAALKYDAASVILAHNHPGGSLAASRNDILSTSKIKRALETINVEVVDHIIVAGDKYISFSEKNILPLGY